MRKRFLLALATLSCCVGAYLILSSGDRLRSPLPANDASRAVRQFVTPANMKPNQTLSQAEMNFSPGDQTSVRIYDENTGRLKYQLQAESWKPVSNNDFQLTKLLIQIFMPKGEITYVSADEAEVTLTRKTKNRFEPRSGRLKKNVKVTIDRTTARWREANPQLADRDAHPDDLIYIDLEEARFDLEQAELKADGPIRVDGVDARIENVRGLTVQWNQVDNRIDVLRFAHGGTMVLRRGGKMIDFAMPGTERAGRKKGPKAAGTSPAAMAAALKAPKAQAMRPMSIEAPRADEAAAQIRLEAGVVAANQPRSLAAAATAPGSGPGSPMRTPQALATDIGTLKAEARAAAGGDAIILTDKDEALPTRRRVHTYRAMFTNKVVVEQMDGLKSLGRIDADKLEINFDFGKKQKELAGAGERDVPAAPLPGHPKAEKNLVDSAAAKPSATPPAPAGTAPPEDKTKLILTWDGPLEMRPLRVDPGQQTGERFDAVATGAPVKLRSEQGEGRCEQLVYRHERKQAWLSASPGRQVELSVGPAQKLIGQEVFFDQSRGLARVEGPGAMVDNGQDPKASLQLDGTVAPEAPGQPTGGKASAKKREPVDIRWTRGVDIEMGKRPIERVNPSTGAKETREGEFLRRAWFHGEVDIRQGPESLSADEVAVTFSAPKAAGEPAGAIEHLNMSGKVRLGRADDVITARQLDAQMIVTADGRNIPRVVDAVGEVAAHQGRREILAEKMHVVMGLVTSKIKTRIRGDMIVPDKPRVGIEALDADGNVFISDPDNNLKIRDAETLRSVMRNGEELVRATIANEKGEKLARARTGDVAIHGRRIEIDAEHERIDVPGPGRAYLLSQRDFGGRRLTKARRVEPMAANAGNIGAALIPWTPLAPSALGPHLVAGAAKALIPAAIAAFTVSDRSGERTRVVWNDEMHFRLGENYGVFLGQVRTDSETFSLSCDKLTVRFAQGPPTADKPAPRREPDRSSKLTQLVTLGSPVRPEAATPNMSLRKRPSSIIAEGRATALASEYAADGVDGRRGRLISRMQIAGRQIMADLVRERMSVPCEGSMLIEDYKFEPTGRGGAARAGPLMAAARGDGPSQTAVLWKNSMDYYVDQNLIAFDKDVQLVHRSGQRIVLRDSLAQAMRINPGDLKGLRQGRLATLTCGSLLLEFRSGAGPSEDGREAGGVARATDLERLVAKRSVHLQEGSRSLMGDYMQYLRSTDEVLVEGAGGTEAGIYDQDEREQRMNMWRGPILIWNRTTNRIEAPRATIRSSRR